MVYEGIGWLRAAGGVFDVRVHADWLDEDGRWCGVLRARELFGTAPDWGALVGHGAVLELPDSQWAERFSSELTIDLSVDGHVVVHGQTRRQVAHEAHAIAE